MGHDYAYSLSYTCFCTEEWPVIANLSLAVQISKSYIPGMDPDRVMSVLQATIPIYRGNGRLGYNESATWQSMERFLVAQNIIPSGQDFSQAYTNLNSL